MARKATINRRRGRAARAVDCLWSQNAGEIASVRPHKLIRATSEMRCTKLLVGRYVDWLNEECVFRAATCRLWARQMER